MAKQSRESKRSKESEGVDFNPTGQRNVVGRFNSRAIWIKLYGLVAILVLTLGLIAVLEYANRSLPSAQKSHFNPFETGTSSQKATSVQTHASTKTAIITKRQVNPGSTPGGPTIAPTSSSNSTSPNPGSTPTGPTPSPSSIDPGITPAGPSSSSSSVASDSTPPSDLTPSNSTDSNLNSTIPDSPTLSNSTESSSNSTTTDSTTDSTINEGTPTSTDPFVPASSSSTLTSTACTATATSGPQCTCPFNSEITDCQCSISPSVSVCTCSIQESNSTESGFFQQCVCPAADTCTECQCPVDPSGGSSRLGDCACPSVPFQAGCSCFWQTASDAGTGVDGCSRIYQCDCGIAVREAQCSAANITAPAGVGVTVVTVSNNATQAPPNSTITISPTALVVSAVNLTTTISTNSSVAIVTTQVNSTLTPAPITQVITPTSAPPRVSVSSSSSSSSSPNPVAPVAAVGGSSVVSAIPLVSLSTTTLSNGQPTVTPVTITPSNPPAVQPVPIVSLSTSTLPNGQPTVTPVTITPSNPPTVQNQPTPIVSLSTTTLSNGQRTVTPVTVTPSITPAVQPVPIVSLSTSTLPNGQPTVTPVTITPLIPSAAQNQPTPIVLPSTSTNPQGQPVVVPVTISPATPQNSANPQSPVAQNPNNPAPNLANSATPIISLSVGTNSLGQPVTAPITITPALLPQTGVIFFISNSFSTNSDGTPVAVPVTFLQAQANPSLSVLTGPSGKEFTVPTALFQSADPTPTPGASSPSQPSSGGGGGGGGGGSGNPPSSDPVKVAVFSWPTSKTFLGGYLPVMVAKIYQMAWQSFHNQARDMAPFNSPSTNTLFGSPDFMSYFTLVPYVASYAMVPFASDGIYFDTNYGCANPNPATPNNPCWPPKMTVNPWVIRLLQGLLSFTAVVSLALIAIWFKKPHGASNDPTSIAAAAAIASHPEVVRDFSCPAETSTSELKKSLKGKKYKLGEYQTANGTTRYGMIPALESHEIQAPEDGEHVDASSHSGMLGKIPFFGWKEISMYCDAVYLLYLFALLAITAVYLRDIDRSTLAKLFDGSTVGRRIVFALIAAVASIYFSKIERDMQTLAPYARLQNLNATPTPTILLRKHTLPLTSFFPMLRNRHFTAALVAFVAILSEFLVITLSGLPYRPGQLRSEFMFCGISSLVILVLMLVVVVVVNVWRTYLPRLPRKPDSVAAVLSYVVGTRMCDDFEGLERTKISERDKRIRELGKKYGYGMREMSGVERWIVDEVGGEDVEEAAPGGSIIHTQEYRVDQDKILVAAPEQQQIGSALTTNKKPEGRYL